MSKFWDAHCHLSKPGVFEDIERWISEAKKVSVYGFVLGGIDPADWIRQKSLKDRYQALFKVSLGIHPWCCKWQKNQIEDAKRKYLETIHSSGWDGFGELGLDFSKRFSTPDRSVQMELFQWQLTQIANFNSAHRGIVENKPLIIHSVGAHSEVLELLNNFSQIKSGMVHSFYGDNREAEEYVEKGFYLSLGPAVLRAKSEFRKTIQKIPIDRMLIETDAPDQGSIVPGVALIHIAKEVAKIRNVDSYQEILAQSTANLFHLFPS